ESETRVMNTRPELHPTDPILHAYGLSKLDDATAESIHAHLEDCPNYHHHVTALSSDSFLDQLRDAQPQADSFRPVVSSTAGLSMLGTAPGPPPLPASTLPPGLADHPDYEIKWEIGRGGMGVVYLAHNRLMERDEVLKVMGRQI